MGLFKRRKAEAETTAKPEEKERLPIGEKEVQQAFQILQEYKKGKANLEQRIVENEQWYKLRHWECMRKKEKKEIEPTSAWLFNCIENKHADAMDNFPSPNILPREEGDKQDAEMLSAIVPTVLDQNDFEGTYSAAWHDMLKGGTAVYGIFWENKKLNGLGDISIVPIDILSIFWEPGITDIQKSRNVFTVELMDNDLLEAQYPEVKGKLVGKSMDVSEYRYDDTVDTTKKSAVIDWYYKKIVDGKTILHYCKFVNDIVLFATENQTKPPMTTEIDSQTGLEREIPLSPALAQRGWYDHGMYPFEFDPLFPIKGTPAGLGYIDIGKNAQEYIDRGNQAIMQNMLVNAKPRYFISTGGAVNEEEYADLSNDFIHVDGALGQDSVIPVQQTGLSSVYVSVIDKKIDELKETTGNRDIATGGTTSGVTAASAIAAMQEAGSKLSRDHIKSSYRTFRRICVQVIELIRQFYDLPRSFRIIGEAGAARYVQYSNANIQGKEIDGGHRVPLFDIEVTAQKQSPYSRMSQNELALQFYGAGFFNPQMADQSLACLEMMDFDRKQFVEQRISQNGTMYQQVMALQQQVMQLTQIVDAQNGTNLSRGAAAGMMGGMPIPRGAPKAEGNTNLGDEKSGESASTKKARQRVAESTSPT